MSELVFLLEEESARAMLEGLLPRLLPDGLPVRFIVFEGKSDLEKHIVQRLRYYRTPGARFVVLRDKDAGDCHLIKAGLVAKCRQANKPDTLVRIACHELESWYLADLEAVKQALNIHGLEAKQGKNKFRQPDALSNAVEEFTKLTQNKYQKVSGSRAIGPYLNLANNRSQSFATFIAGVRRLIIAAQSD